MDTIPTAQELGLMTGGSRASDRVVTLANWDEPPFSRWSFRNVRQLIPTAPLRRGPGPIWDLPSDPRDLAGITVGGLDESVELPDALRASYVDAMAVVHRGRIVFEHYHNGMSEESLHIIMSVSKSLTSLLVGVLVGRGQIDLTAQVSDYVPELSGTGFDGASVQDVLDMTVATDWDETYSDPAFKRYDMAAGWAPILPDTKERSLWALARAMGPVQRRHGLVHQYSSPNTEVLAWVVERVAGGRFADLFEREIWQPIGAEFDADITVDARGDAVADGGMSTTLRDLCRVGQLMLNGGRAGDRQVVPEVWVEECWESGDPQVFARGTYKDLQPGRYRNHWWWFDGKLHALGVHGQVISIDRREEAVVVLLSSEPEPSSADRRKWRRALVNSVIEGLSGEQ